MDEEFGLKSSEPPLLSSDENPLLSLDANPLLPLDANKVIVHARQVRTYAM